MCNEQPNRDVIQTPIVPYETLVPPCLYTLLVPVGAVRAKSPGRVQRVMSRERTQSEFSDEQRLRVRLTRSGDRPISIQAIRSAMYRSPILQSEPELFGVTLEVNSAGIQDLDNELGLEIEIVGSDP